MSVDDFRLKWDDHHSVFFGSAEMLRQNGILTDVTLSCDGGEKEFPAHKLILASFSAYFAGLFAGRVESRDDRCSHPARTVVHLRGMDPGHMELILDYMYGGEIHVRKDDLTGLLDTAKALRVKGLVDDEPAAPEAAAAAATTKSRRAKTAGKKRSGSRADGAANKMEDEPEVAATTNAKFGGGAKSGGRKRPRSGADKSKAKKIKAKSSGRGGGGNENVMAAAAATAEAVAEEEDPRGAVPEEEHEEGHEEEEGIDHDDQVDPALLMPETSLDELAPAVVQSLTPDADGNYRCHYCQKTCQKRWLMKRHLTCHTGQQPHSCKICGKKFSHESSAVRHFKDKHPDVKEEDAEEEEEKESQS